MTKTVILIVYALGKSRIWLSTDPSSRDYRINPLAHTATIEDSRHSSEARFVATLQRRFSLSATHPANLQTILNRGN
jgi:hypothetical protein